MPLEPFEPILLIIGMGLISIPGIMISYAFSQRCSILERIAFGFIITLSLFGLVPYLFNFFFQFPITENITFFIFVLYLISGIIVYSIQLFFKGLPDINFKSNITPHHGILLLILIFTGIMAFLPHFSNHYYLPFHVDEWVHWTYTRSVIESAATTFPNPYLGTGVKSSPEIGFHITTASLHFILQRSFLTIFLYMPTLIMITLSLVAYNIGQRSTRPFGLEAAFLIGFIPTTTQSLGPSFYVASTLGLLLFLFLIWIIQQKQFILTLLIIPISWSLFLIHPPTSFAAILIIFLYATFQILYKDIKPGLTTIAAGILITIPPIVTYLIPSRWQREMNTLFEGFLNQEYLEGFIIGIELEHLGLFTWALFFIGIYFCYIHGQSLKKFLSISVISFFIIIGLYSIISYGVPIIYQRSFLYLYLLVVLIAAIGLNEFRKTLSKIIYRRLPNQFNQIKKQSNHIITFILIIILIGTIIPGHINIPYYQMITEEDYTTFTWIHDNIDSYHHDNQSYTKAAVNPYKASPFSAITGLTIYTSNMHPRIRPNKQAEMFEYLQNKCNNTKFLDKYDIDVIYGECYHDNLTMIYPNVYLYPKPSKYKD